MKSLNQINQEIFALRQKGLFDEALSLYKEQVHGVFSNQEIAPVDRLVANVLFCLRKKHQYTQAVAYVLRTLQLDPGWKEHPLTSAELGWCLYFLTKQTPNTDLIAAMPQHITMAIAFTGKIDPAKEYLLFSLLFHELSKKLMIKGKAVEALYKLIQSLDDTWFEKDVKNSDVSSAKNNKPGVESASDLETFLVRKAKAALLTSDLETAINTCNHAFAIIGRFHHGNHVWLARTLSMALMQSGNPQLATEKMKEILRKKKDWFLYHELAGMYYQMGDNENALLNFARAFIQQGHSPYKAGLYEQLATRYAGLISEQMLTLLPWLAIKTRQSQQWKIPAELSAAVLSGKQAEPEQTPEVLYALAAAEFGKIAEKETGDNSSAPQAEGTITRILNSGENGDGFITASDGRSIYFRMKKVQGDINNIEVGKKVKLMALERQYNGKKVYNALWVKLL